MGTHSRLPKRCGTQYPVPASSENGTEWVGGQTSRVITTAVDRHTFNTKACASCHESMTGESVEKSQQETKDPLTELSSMLPQRETKSSIEMKQPPRMPKDPVLYEIQSNASDNLDMIIKDGSLGEHNPVYTRQLLKESIKQMKQQRKKSKTK